MEKIQNKARFAVAVVLISVCVSVVVAAVMKTVYIDTAFYIEKDYNIGLFDVDGVTPLTAIDLGTLQKDVSKIVPETGYYFLNNTNEGAFYVGFNVENAPPDMIWRLYIKKGNETEWTQLTVDSDSPATMIYDKIIESSYTNPNPDTHFAHWYLYVYAGTNAPSGNYTAKLVFTTHDSPTG